MLYAVIRAAYKQNKVKEWGQQRFGKRETARRNSSESVDVSRQGKGVRRSEERKWEGVKGLRSASLTDTSTHPEEMSFVLISGYTVECSSTFTSSMLQLASFKIFFFGELAQ